jgi:hypothetical protein
MWNDPLHPESWFRRRADSMNGGRALLIALFVALVLTAQVGGFVWLLSERMTGTITRDNPDRPPDWVCDDESESAFSELNTTPAGCDQPKRETVEIGTLVWRAASDRLVGIFFGLLLLWILGGVVIHLLAGGIESHGSFGQTLEVLAWCGVVELVFVAISMLLLLASVGDATLSASDPDALLSAIRSLTSGPLPALARAIGIGGVLSQSYVLYGGLVGVHETDRFRAGVVAVLFGMVLGLSMLT